MNAFKHLFNKTVILKVYLVITFNNNPGSDYVLGGIFLQGSFLKKIVATENFEVLH